MYEEKLSLFEGITGLPDADTLRGTNVFYRKKDRILERKASDFVSSHIKKSMTDRFKKQGFDDEKIKQMINEFGQNAKDAKLKTLETQFGIKNG